MIGRRWRAPLGFLLGVNSALGPNAVFVAVTLVSIAASVALATSLELASRAVQRLATDTARALAGSAQLEITAGQVGIPERLVDEVAALPGVAEAAPVVQATLGLDVAHLPLHILGLDLVATAGTRELGVRGRGGVEVADPLKLLGRSDAVLISERLAAKLGVSFGDPIRARAPNGVRELHVEGLLADRGLARAYAGQVAVMDVYALQALVGREGFVDRIRVTASPGVDVAALEARLVERVAGAATVQRAGAGRSALDLSVNALRAAVLIVASVGALVAGLLCYAAMSTAVERRLPEFAVLRATGFAARDVARFIAWDAALLALCGSALGLAAGRVLAKGFLPALSQTSEYFIQTSASASDVSFTRETLAVAAAVGLTCGFAGTLGPARMATRRYALEPGGAAAAPARRPWLPLALAAALAALAVAPGVAPRTRLGLELVMGAVLAGSLVGPALRQVDRARPALSGVLPAIGHLLGTGLSVRLRGTALAVAAITAIVAFIHAVLILSGSFGATLLDRVRASYPGSIFVSASPPFDDMKVDPMAPDVIEAIRRAPGVEALSEQVFTEVPFRGHDVTLVAIDASICAPRTGTTPAAKRLGATLRAVGRGELAVSEAFAHRFGVSAGDELELSTPKGARRFRVAGFTRGMAGPAGIITLDLATYDAYWKRVGARSVLMWPRGDPAPVVEAVRRATYARQPLFFTDGRALVERATVFANRFDSLLFGVAALALFLGGVAIANLLLASVAARRRELALLRAAGAEPGQLALLVLADGLLIALTSIALGTGLGQLLTGPMLQLFAEDFGLIVERHPDPPRLLAFLAMVLAAVLASALYPALLARGPADLTEPQAE